MTVITKGARGSPPLTPRLRSLWICSHCADELERRVRAGMSATVFCTHEPAHAHYLDGRGVHAAWRRNVLELRECESEEHARRNDCELDSSSE